MDKRGGEPASRGDGDLTQVNKNQEVHVIRPMVADTEGALPIRCP